MEDKHLKKLRYWAKEIDMIEKKITKPLHNEYKCLLKPEWQKNGQSKLHTRYKLKQKKWAVYLK